MKKKILVFSTAIIFSWGVFAQEENPKNGMENENQGTYLDVYHAKDKAFRLKEENKKEIYRLKITVANFGEAGDKQSLKTSLDNYKVAIKTLYSRNYMKSSSQLEKNREEINVLYAKFAEKYRKIAQGILDKCADQLVDLELSEVSGMAPQDSAHTKTISKIRIRLMVAYGQLSMAEGLEKSEKYSDSISHFRVAIYHGVDILRSLAKNQDEEKKIMKDYEVHLADVENKVGPGKSAE